MISIPTSLCECDTSVITFNLQPLAVSLCICPSPKPPIPSPIIPLIKRKTMYSCYPNFIKEISQTKFCVTGPKCLA